MKTTTFLFLFVILGCMAQTSTDRVNILQTLNNQSLAWNKGDLKSFMVGYWESDSLMYIGKRGIVYGYNATLDSYQKNYGNSTDLGQLSFEVQIVNFLSETSCFVVGKWHLVRHKTNDIGGHFSLLWRKINERWLIVADHSS